MENMRTLSQMARVNEVLARAEPYIMRYDEFFNAARTAANR